MRVLVGIMYSGENEYEACLASIDRQTYRPYERFAVENLPNKEAHDALYARFNAEREHFDLFLKMDADMVFLSDQSMANMVAAFAADPALDRLMVDVLDTLSGVPIPGQNLYSSRVRWELSPDEFAVENHGVMNGRFVRLWDKPLAAHMPDPSPFQAFAFGVHRALKAFQPGLKKKGFGQAMIHWTILNKIYDTYLRLGDVRRLYALAGAAHAMEATTSEELATYKLSSGLQSEFSTRWQPLCDDQPDAITKFWAFPVRALIILLDRLQST